VNITKTIGELFDLRKGRKAPETFMSMISGAKRYIQIDDLRSNKNTTFAKDSNGIDVLPEDLCIAWDGANAGTVGYGLTGFIGSTITRLRKKDNQSIFTPFFGQFLQSKFKVLNKLTTGSTIPHISKDRLLNIKVLYPSDTEEQKRIAHILKTADALRQKRQQAVELADEFLRSVFLDMFGDPITNPKGWKMITLSELTEPERPITYGVLKPGPNYSKGIPLLKIENIQCKTINTNNLHQISPELSKQYKRTILKGGEVVISLVGTIGLVALVPKSLEGGNIHRNLGLIAPNDSISIHYLLNLLNLPQFKIILRKTIKGGVQSLLNLSDLKSIKVPLPSLELQNKFGVITQTISSIKDKATNFQQCSDDLFKTSIQRAFRGEL
jgi:type I restriction enzyme, S subunit